MHNAWCIITEWVITNFLASSASPPWEGAGEVPISLNFLPSASHSPPWEGLGEALQVSTPLPWGGVGGGYLLNYFTNAFAGRGVLRSKSIAVGNTRVLSEFATRWQSSYYKEQGKIWRKIRWRSPLVWCKLHAHLLHFALYFDADRSVIWRKTRAKMMYIAR